MKKWNLLHKTIDKGQPASPAGRLTIDKLIKILLKNRGLTKKDEIELFLHPNLSEITPETVGFDLKELKKAVSRIKEALLKNEKIVVFGDYDVDGICGTAILWETLYSQSKNVTAYIPDRFEEGYGLSIKGVDNVLKKHPDTSLIITVDNGIVAYEAVEYANSKNITVIVTDHHVLGAKPLAYYALVHTTKLCGTGVAWLLAQQFQTSQKGKNLDLVALATIADLVSLTFANRALVKFGLAELQKTKRIGLRELFAVAGIQRGKIGVYEIGHVIAPRLNAAGRLFSAMDALRLLCTKDIRRAASLARNLHLTNRERQDLTAQTTDHANLASLAASNSRIVFVHHDSYNEGIIGLVASRLVEKYYRPAFVIARGESVSKGSARSISGVNIIEMIRSVSDYIIQAGGHPMAAGFTVETTRIEELEKALAQRAEELVLDELLQRELKIDLNINFEDITPEFFAALGTLSPFGMGNPEPTFLTEGVTIEEIKPVGKDAKHLKMKLSECRDGKTTTNHDCIAFGVGQRTREFKVGSTVDAVYTIAEDTWMRERNGVEQKLQLKIKDIRTQN